MELDVKRSREKLPFFIIFIMLNQMPVLHKICENENFELKVACPPPDICLLRGNIKLQLVLLKKYQNVTFLQESPWTSSPKNEIFNNSELEVLEESNKQSFLF